MGNLIPDIRNLLNQFEQVCEDMARDKGVEHLSGPQGWALGYLQCRQDEETFVKDIEKEMKISKSVASNLVKRMEKNGFIQVLPSKEDKRYKQIVLTDKGTEKVSRLTDFHKEMHNSLFQNIKKEDFETIIKVAKQLKANILDYKEHQKMRLDDR